MLMIGLSPLQAQTDFNHYWPIVSKGSIPKDFLTSTVDKIKENKKETIDDLSKAKKDNFIEQINFSIDQVLHSGKVTFGDPVSLYIQQVAKRLLADDPELADTLRFYTYNATQSNAFSTRQGIIFVTTGLIAQMTSEAQLAFVLSHEIVHYKEEHVLSLYTYAVNNKFSYGERLRFLTNYSRENELEADAKAVEMVYKAGYDPREIDFTFDALMYSYLPFEEIPYDFESWNTPNFYFPKSAYNFEKKAITVSTNYDDRQMSHPNLEKRKDQIAAKVEEYKEWQNNRFFDSIQFFEIRDICRFEYVHQKLYEDSPIDALYGVQILQHKYPNSEFLRACEAQAWLLLIKPKRKTKNWLFYSYFDRKEQARYKSYEGEISVLERTLSAMNSVELNAIAIRKIHDIYVTDTSNTSFKKFWNLVVEIVGNNSDFTLNRFGKQNFDETAKELQKNIEKPDPKHSDVFWDKYKVIENNRAGLRLDKGIDTSKYYYYCIPDLMNDTTFVSNLDSIRKKAKRQSRKDEEFNLLTDDEQVEARSLAFYEHLHINLDSVLIMAPAVYEMRTFGGVDVGKSAISRTNLIQVIQKELKEQKLNGGLLLMDSIDSNHIDTWNLNMYLMRAMDMAIYTGENDVFIQDLAYLQALKKSLGYSKVMFLEYMHIYDPGLDPLNIALFTILAPVGLVYFPVAILSGHKSDWQYYILDLDTGKIIISEAYLKNESSGRKNMRATVNGMFNQLKQAKDAED